MSLFGINGPLPSGFFLRRAAAVFLLLVTASIALRLHATAGHLAATEHLAQRRAEADTAHVKFKTCERRLAELVQEEGTLVEARRALVKGKNANALEAQRDLEKCRNHLRQVSGQAKTSLDYDIALLEAQLEGGAPALRFAIYETVADLSGEQPETTWRQQLDTEELRNTLIAAMAAKLDISLTRLQATETEALVELARVPPPQRMPHQSR